MYIESKNINTSVANKRHQRRVIRDDINVALAYKVGKKTYPVTVKLANISPRGMAFKLNKSLRSSVPISFAIRFSHGKKFIMKGRVVYKNQEIETTPRQSIFKSFKEKLRKRSHCYQYGIEFGAVDDNFQTTFVSTLLEKNGNVSNQYQVHYS